MQPQICTGDNALYVRSTSYYNVVVKYFPLQLLVHLVGYAFLKSPSQYALASASFRFKTASSEARFKPGDKNTGTFCLIGDSRQSPLPASLVSPPPSAALCATSEPQRLVLLPSPDIRTSA